MSDVDACVEGSQDGCGIGGPISALLTLAGVLSVQGSRDSNVSLVVNMDAARLGLDSRRIEIDVTAAARALGAAVGPQVAHLSAMMQQAAQAGQGAGGHRATGDQLGAQPGAGAAAGEVPMKCCIMSRDSAWCKTTSRQGACSVLDYHGVQVLQTSGNT